MLRSTLGVVGPQRIRVNSRFRAALTIFVFSTGCFADTIGNAVIARPFVDSGSGQMFAYPGVFPTSGERVTSWSFYSDHSACCVGPGTTITPLIFDASSWQITGIGTTRPNSLTGVQTYPFDLVTGSDIVGAHSTFGWYVPGGSPGVVDYSNVGAGAGDVYFGEGGVDFGAVTVGNIYAVKFISSELHSIQFTTACQVTISGPGYCGPNEYRASLAEPHGTRATGTATFLITTPPSENRVENAVLTYILQLTSHATAVEGFMVRSDGTVIADLPLGTPATISAANCGCNFSDLLHFLASGSATMSLMVQVNGQPFTLTGPIVPAVNSFTISLGP